MDNLRDGELRGHEFGRWVLAASRSGTPRLPPPHRLEPPTSPMCNNAASPVLPALDTSAVDRPTKLKFNLLPAVSDLDTQPVTPEALTASTPEFLQPEPVQRSQPYHYHSSTVSWASPDRRLPMTSPVSPPLEPPLHVRTPVGSPIYKNEARPSQEDLRSFGEPHPLNILADISSAAPKSPVGLSSSPLAAQRSISKCSPVGAAAKRTRKPSIPVSALSQLSIDVPTLASPRPAYLKQERGLQALQSTQKSCGRRTSTYCEPNQMASGARRATVSDPELKGIGNVKPRISANGKRVFQCEQCASTFSERFNLNKHVRAVHERRRPFECSTCKQRFQQRDHMQKHEMCVHKKVRQFECEICHSSFGWRGVLKKHRRSVHRMVD